MATLKMGALVTGMAGKVGGQVVQRGRSGYQLRNLTQPRKLNTDSLQTSQAQLGAIARSWSLLLESNREQWNGLAATSTRFNRFGEPYTPTGYQLWMEYNKTENLLSPGSLFTNPPAPAAVAPISNVELSGSLGPADFMATWSNDSGNMTQTVAAFMYSVGPAGQTPQHRTPVFLRVDAPIQNASIDLTAAIVKQFPRALNVGLRVSVGLRVYATTHGVSGPMFLASSIVTA